MRHQSFGLVAALLLAGVVGGEPPKSPAPADEPREFAGKVVPLPAPKAGAKPGLALKADDGTTFPIIEDDASRMLFVDARLRNRPMRLTAIPAPGTKDLRVVRVQTVKDGRAFDVDYWCEVCKISHNCPGQCVCCGEDVERRERPVP